MDDIFYRYASSTNPETDKLVIWIAREL